MEDDNNTACKILMTKTELRKSLDFVNEERERLQQENERKDNIINDLKSSIADYQEAVGDYQDELKRKDNIINEIKKFVENELNHNVDKEKSFMGYQCKIILDKIKELENDN